MNPPVSPAEIAAIIFAEALFGIGFNRLVEWAHLNKLWDVSISVVMGVTVTVLIPTLTWWRVTMDFWLAAALLSACFAASGTPMIIGSMRRTVEESHKRRPWPTAAAQARDNAVMDLTMLADQVANEQLVNAKVVHQLHQVIGTLKSV